MFTLPVAGVVLLLVAAGAAWFWRKEQAEAQLAKATQTFPCAHLIEQSGSGAGYRERCEIVGAAKPGTAGVLKAPESGLDVVWHRTTVEHKFEERERYTNSDGDRRWRTVERSEEVSDDTSGASFLVQDDSGSVLVQPSGAEIDEPEQVVDRFVHKPEQRQEGWAGVFDSLVSSEGERETIGFAHREWVIRPDQRLYVHGEASNATGQLQFAQSEGRYIVSTRSEEAVVKESERNAKIALAVAVVAGVLGLGLLAAGTVA